MANREKSTIDKSGRGQRPSVSSMTKHNGVHTVAEKFKEEDKSSKVNAYRKAIVFCQTSIEEVRQIAESLQVDISKLLPTT